jgi:hypothetical protein
MVRNRIRHYGKENAMSEAQRTHDHEMIRTWVEERGGAPATVASTSDGEAGILRIDFPGYRGEDRLKRIPWDEFFQKFDSAKLDFLYQEETDDGETSRFCKFVQRTA